MPAALAWCEKATYTSADSPKAEPALMNCWQNVSLQRPMLAERFTNRARPSNYSACSGDQTKHGTRKDKGTRRSNSCATDKYQCEAVKKNSMVSPECRPQAGWGHNFVEVNATNSTLVKSCPLVGPLQNARSSQRETERALHCSVNDEILGRGQTLERDVRRAAAGLDRLLAISAADATSLHRAAEFCG